MSFGIVGDGKKRLMIDADEVIPLTARIAQLEQYLLEVATERDCYRNKLERISDIDFDRADVVLSEIRDILEEK